MDRMHPNDDMLNGFVDGTLGPSDRAAVERQLAQCADCRRIAEELGDVVRSAAALEPLEPPARAWQTIAGRLSGDRGPEALEGSRRGLRYTWLAMAAILVLAAVI